MNETTRSPELLDEKTLSSVIGGAEYLAPGVYVEEVSFRAKEADTKTATVVKRR